MFTFSGPEGPLSRWLTTSHTTRATEATSPSTGTTKATSYPTWTYAGA